MMFAKHPETLLIPHLRGELEGAERARVAAHLEGCDRCRSECDTLSATIGTLRQKIADLPMPDAASYRAELRRKMASRQERKRSWWRPTLIAASFATAGVAVVIMTGWFSLHRGPNVDQLALADADLGMLRAYPVVEKMDLLENYDVIEHLDDLNAPPTDTTDARHS